MVFLTSIVDLVGSEQAILIQVLVLPLQHAEQRTAPGFQELIRQGPPHLPRLSALPFPLPCQDLSWTSHRRVCEVLHTLSRCTHWQVLSCDEHAVLLPSRV